MTNNKNSYVYVPHLQPLPFNGFILKSPVILRYHLHVPHVQPLPFNGFVVEEEEDEDDVMSAAHNKQHTSLCFMHCTCSRCPSTALS
jgi:hypothetical protein